MCAVIGVSINQPTDADLQTIRNLFFESRIRGRHATGVSYLKDGKLITIKEPIPADEFLQRHDPEDWTDGDLIRVIGHCRYSTSDLQYNQPIADEELSVVHNGVISQELPENWPKLYGVECETKNDTELLFHALKEGKSPEYWSDSSISTVWLTRNGELNYTRNGKRPMWVTEHERGVILTSTKDIAKRAGIIHGIRRVDYQGRDLQPTL